MDKELQQAYRQRIKHMLTELNMTLREYGLAEFVLAEDYDYVLYLFSLSVGKKIKKYKSKEKIKIDDYRKIELLVRVIQNYLIDKHGEDYKKKLSKK